MKWIELSDSDYKLFDQEVDSEQNEFMQSHICIWEQMFQEQGQSFWLHFLISYRSFTLNHGFANDLDNVLFPLCKSKLRRLIDDACITMHKEFVEASFSVVKKLFNDIVVVVRNRHLIPHLGSQSSEDDPFYHEDTKNAYRDLFCESGHSTTAWKVAVGVPFYLKFAGSVYNILKKWIEGNCMSCEEMEGDSTGNPYWTIPAEWCDKDFKPGIFEQYLLKFWDKKLTEVLNNEDIYEKFSQKLYYDPCYLENDCLSCVCDNNHTYGTDDVEPNCKCTKKVVHKSGGCRIRTDLLPSEITNTIAQAQKVQDTKERLRKKLGKKLRNKGEEGNAVSEDCAADSYWRLKLLEKAEKQFKKENKSSNLESLTTIKTESVKSDVEEHTSSTPNKDENIKSTIAKQTKVSNKTKKLDLKEHIDASNDKGYVCINVITSTEKTNQKQICSKGKKMIDKNSTQKEKLRASMKKAEINTKKKTANEKDSSQKKRTQMNTNTSADQVDLSNRQINDKKDKKPTVSKSYEQDELTKDLEDIGDNLDNIEKSIKEKGGLDFEEFKLLLETGRLLMKDSKSVKTETNSASSNSVQKIIAKLHVCAQCLTKESAPKTFKKCSRCKLEKFVVPRYYCSKKCQVEDWEESHRAEHLRANNHKI